MSKNNFLKVITLVILIAGMLTPAYAQIWPFGGGQKQPSGGSLFGIVIGPSGLNTPGARYSPVEGAAVEAKGQHGTFNTVSDAQGGFKFMQIPEGEYTITISKPGYGPFIKQVKVNKADLVNMDHISLIPGGGISAPGEVIPPDTAYVAFAVIKDDANSSMTSQWKKGAIKMGADPYSLEGNSPLDNSTPSNPYEHDTNITSYDNSLMTINPSDPAKLNYVKLDGTPTFLCFNIAGTKLYVADTTNLVMIYDVLHNNMNIGNIRLGSAATDMTLSPDGKWLFIANADGVTVVDTINHVPVNTIEMPQMSNGQFGFPMALTCSPDGMKIYVALSTADSGEVVAIDAYTKQPVGRAMVGSCPTGIAISPDGSKLYVADHNSADVAVLSANPLSLLTRTSVGVSPARLAVSPDGAKVYVSCKGTGTVAILSGPSGSNIGTVNVGKEPIGIAVTGDGSRIYVANSADGTVSIIDAKAGFEIKRTKAQPKSRPCGVAVKP
ncbi:MAG: carboxypeptidase regulatory-like domain-containing protein [Firmicutes bacterium]|nr:carboxypeptidase regulatory-like domain-containing protein [Bacillota bacterium]